MTDSQIISHYGGPANFSRLLGLNTAGSVQRVSNWVTRGIPADIKLAHPDLFGIVIGDIKLQPTTEPVSAAPKPDQGAINA